MVYNKAYYERHKEEIGNKKRQYENIGYLKRKKRVETHQGNGGGVEYIEEDVVQ